MTSRSIKQVLRRFRQDSQGASAIEFALIAPLLLLLLLGTFEITRAFSVNRKLEQTASTLTRMVTRTTSVSASDLSAYVTAAGAVMYPHSIGSDLLKVTIQRIDQNGEDKAEVKWIYDWNKNTLTTPTKPEDKESAFIPTENSVIRAQLSYTYKLTFPSALSGFNISDFTLTASSVNVSETGAQIDRKP